MWHAMSETQIPSTGARGPVEPTCTVNSTFNFTVGALAIVAAVLIAYWVYVSWWK
jgi:hypothetical protein